MKDTRKDIRKIRKRNLITSVSAISIASIYFGLRLGNVVHETGMSMLDAGAVVMDYMMEAPFQIFPSDIGCFLISLLVAGIPSMVLLNDYIIKAGAVDNAHGDAAFEENYSQYDKEFCFEPKVTLSAMGKKVNNRTTYQLDAKDDEEEHKKVIKQSMEISRKDKKLEKKLEKKMDISFERYVKEIEKFSSVYKARHVARMQSQIYAEGIYLSLNGAWCQRNSNALVFGAAGAGKSRFFLKPNLLQVNSCYIVTDPSGDIMQDCGDFLEKQGYTIKCLNTKDMTKSNRFNPLYYVRKTEDIPVIVNTLMENTKGENAKPSGGDPFWDKATQSLLCAIIGYLYEVCPLEQRNFANVLEILRMANIEEGATEVEENDFDKLFKALGEANPASFAYLNYTVFKQAPAKTALNVLISTGVLLSQYIGIPEFKNLTYKDELELDKLGEEKYVIFLNIPQADVTYAWITAMLYSISFRLMYEKGELRMEAEDLGSPELKIPVRFLIDECANVGKIPNLEKILATCRKYRISVVPIFQNYSQIIQVYGKEIANNILANCDTIIFLGGADEATLKVVCNNLGKETVQTLSYGSSKGRMGSNSINKQSTGKELMSKINVSQMSNALCLVMIRALKPFKVHKYRLEKHPHYRFTAGANKKYTYKNRFEIEYDDETIENVRIKKINEEGYIPPKEIQSATKRAKDIEKARIMEEKRQAVIAWRMDNPTASLDEALKKLKIPRDEMILLWKETGNTKMVSPESIRNTDESMTAEKEQKLANETVPRLQGQDIFDGIKIENLAIAGAYKPAYEFDMVEDFVVENEKEEMDATDKVSSDMGKDIAFDIPEVESEMNDEEDSIQQETIDEENIETEEDDEYATQEEILAEMDDLLYGFDPSLFE